MIASTFKPPPSTTLNVEFLLPEQNILGNHLSIWDFHSSKSWNDVRCEKTESWKTYRKAHNSTPIEHTVWIHCKPIKFLGENTPFGDLQIFFQNMSISDREAWKIGRGASWKLNQASKMPGMFLPTLWVVAKKFSWRNNDVMENSDKIVWKIFEKIPKSRQKSMLFTTWIAFVPRNETLHVKATCCCYFWANKIKGAHFSFFSIWIFLKIMKFTLAWIWMKEEK